MKVHLVLLVVLFTVISITNFAQCPANEADFQNGGAFSGDCVLGVGANVTLDASALVTWVSGTLTITGGSGRIVVSNGSTLDVQGGNIVSIDDGDANGNSDGPINILDGGTVNVASGASLICAEGITVNGTLNVYGTVESLRSTFLIFGATASINVFSTGSLMMNGTGDNLVSGGGSLNVDGDFTTSGDLEIIGGSAIVSQNGTIAVGDDLLVYGDGSLLIENGAVVTVADDVANADDTPTFPTIFGNGSINIAGQLEVSGDLTIYDTTPNSDLLGTVDGEITVVGNFSDAECANYAAEDYTFCHCSGGGSPCSSVLPVELVSFTAQQQGSVVELKWLTASELNNHFFIVERFNATDKSIVLKEVPGKGSVNSMSEYAFIDSAPLVGNNYYQLKQVDFNGLFKYSGIIKVEYNLFENELLVFPNPCIDQTLQIRASNLEPNTLFTLTIVSMHRDSYVSKNITTNYAGDLSVKLDVTDLNSGFYIVSVASLKTTFVK